MPVILFDLNETLVFRDFTLQPDGKHHLTVHIRPYTLETILKLSKTYTLGIASSCNKKNIFSMLGTIFAGSGERWQTHIKHIFDREFTIKAPKEDDPYHTVRKVEEIKKKVGDDVLFIDNEESKYEGTTALRLIVPSFTGDSEDRVLLDIDVYVQALLS